ncbi:hypothetical protein CFP56_006606 [Quercus suber]|uniref:Uncharacterized protein n=1 Tax=Quercus suber TaxID=58331 RepID=A0AAW0L709_QUESU
MPQESRHHCRSCTILSIADLTSPAATDPFLHCRSRRSHKPSRHKPSVLLCTHSVLIEKDQATPLVVKSGS